MLRSILFYLAGCASTFALGWAVRGIWDLHEGAKMMEDSDDR